MPHISSAPSSTWDMSREALALFLRSYRGTRPRFASGTLMSLQEGIAVLRARMVVLKPSCREPAGRCPDLPYGVTAMP